MIIFFNNCYSHNFIIVFVYVNDILIVGEDLDGINN